MSILDVAKAKWEEERIEEWRSEVARLSKAISAVFGEESADKLEFDSEITTVIDSLDMEVRGVKGRVDGFDFFYMKYLVVRNINGTFVPIGSAADFYKLVQDGSVKQK